jgi:beta-glucosidase/6-phospho-beta-glucosidase/beta-galactosidase
VDDIDSFIASYGSIFNMGTYNNVKKGFVDVYGINYYTVEDVKNLIDRITKEKPIDYQILLEWLSKAYLYNGVYILGI